jgi:hypothetical protein
MDVSGIRNGIEKCCVQQVGNADFKRAVQLQQSGCIDYATRACEADSDKGGISPS